MALKIAFYSLWEATVNCSAHSGGCNLLSMAEQVILKAFVSSFIKLMLTVVSGTHSHRDILEP